MKLDQDHQKAESVIVAAPSRFRLELLKLGTRQPARPAATKTSSRAISHRLLAFGLIAGVILPAVTAIAEHLNGACAELFFDPIPTPWHVGLILLVSVVNLAAMATLAMQQIVPQAEWGARTSSHLARLWAADEATRLASTGLSADHESAARLAAGYQLVTAVSGAVALESQSQYDQAGLTPVEARSVPTVPEPEARYRSRERTI